MTSLDPPASPGSSPSAGPHRTPAEAAPGTLLQAAGPAISAHGALQRLSGEATLLMLHGGAGGWSYLAWDAHLDLLQTFTDPAFHGSVHTVNQAPSSGLGAWSGRFQGGGFLQMDYEFPRVPARLWRVPSFVAWDPAGLCTLHAHDQAGLERLHSGLARLPPTMPGIALTTPLLPAWDAAGHQQRILTIAAHIADGDIYQANLGVPFRAGLQPAANTDVAVFIALSRASPAPYAVFLRSAGRTIISHSPECFLQSHAGRVVSEPIKGTRRRIAGHEQEVRSELLHATKDRAELAMIIDLVRNDLGRVCQPGSVHVTQAAHLLDLSYVHHLVGRIEGQLRPGISLGTLLAACFPAGSITGAPKRRAMEIIHQVERGTRGPYCGTFGWINHQGEAELAVAIRTLVVDNASVCLHAGGGIVADSVAGEEWAEVQAKASAMAHALGVDL